MKTSQTIEINRSEIKFAPYNPRKEDPEVVKSIKDNFKKIGYLGGIVVNKTTMNLVSGHKRVQALDLINKYDGSVEMDYTLKVEMIELSLKQEKEQNIYMNNKAVQGVYDYKALALMLPEIDVVQTGLTGIDLEKINVFRPGSIEIKPIAQKKEIAEDQKEKYIETIKEAKKAGREKAYQAHDDAMNGHLTIVFDNWDQKIEFMEHLNLDIDAKMVSGSEVLEKIYKLEL